MSFGLAKIDSIRYYSYKDKIWKTSTIKNIKCLAVLGKIDGDGEPGRWNRGHNLCIVFGQKEKEAFEDICFIFSKGTCHKNSKGINCIENKFFPLTMYLLGENGVKIPVLCSEANNWYLDRNIDYGEQTACIFAYLPAMIFDLDKYWDDCEYNYPDVFAPDDDKFKDTTYETHVEIKNKE